MSTYIMLANYTDQGIRNIKESPKRADAARDLAKSCGAEMKDLYPPMRGTDSGIRGTRARGFRFR